MDKFVNTVFLLALISTTLSPTVLAGEKTGSKIFTGLNYTRTGGPTAAELSLAFPTEPDIAAAHALSLNYALTQKITDAQRNTLAEYGPWLTKGGISNNAQQLIRAIQDAAVHGLNPEAYALSEILHSLDTLTHLERSQPTELGSIESDLEISLSTEDTSALRNRLEDQLVVAFRLLATHMGRGVVDARSTQTRLYRDVPTVKPESLLNSLNKGQLTVSEALNSLMPSQPAYLALTQRMRDLLTERASGVGRTVVALTSELAEPQKLSDTINIKLRLIETSELPLTTLLTPLWDEELQEALRAFQKRHGTPQTGIADDRTRAALRLSVDEEIKAIALSLERWRWMPRDLGEKYLFVNIPDYRIFLRDGDEVLLSMVTVVGSVNHPTPTFSRDMSYMEFNPTWTVPASITNRELIPKERRKPGYLDSRNFDFLQRQGKHLIKVPREQVTAADFQQALFPYVLQQRGGPTNALGRMKFMMPNPYAIYLHDTQAKRLFTLNDRAYSHGCIRLSEPDRLAKLLMRGDHYNDEQITSALAATKTNRVRLRTPIPTHLTYLTTWIDDNGALQRRADVYNHDNTLASALKANNTLLTLLIQISHVIVAGDQLASGG